MGEIYHFDLFHAETRLCTSEFLLEIEDTTFISDPINQVPMDYSATAAEDFYVDGIVSTLALTDVFSTGLYQITLYGGEAGLLRPIISPVDNALHFL